jgi:hypothetical protein
MLILTNIVYAIVMSVSISKKSQKKYFYPLIKFIKLWNYRDSHFLFNPDKNYLVFSLATAWILTTPIRITPIKVSCYSFPGQVATAFAPPPARQRTPPSQLCFVGTPRALLAPGQLHIKLLRLVMLTYVIAVLLCLSMSDHENLIIR